MMKQKRWIKSNKIQKIEHKANYNDEAERKDIKIRSEHSKMSNKHSKTKKQYTKKNKVAVTFPTTPTSSDNDDFEPNLFEVTGNEGNSDKSEPLNVRERQTTPPAQKQIFAEQDRYMRSSNYYRNNADFGGYGYQSRVSYNVPSKVKKQSDNNGNETEGKIINKVRNSNGNNGILFYQKSWYTTEQMRYISNKYSKIKIKNAPKMLFGDNDSDNKRNIQAKRQYFGGQAKVMGNYDKSIAFGIITTFYQSKFPKWNEFKILMDRQFKQLQQHLLNGNDIVIPKATSMDIKTNGKQRYFKNNKQVIFHNIGTGIAALKHEYVAYIQFKIDTLRQYATYVKFGKYYDYIPASDHMRNNERPHVQHVHENNWICAKCKYSNFDTRTQCRKCKKKTRHESHETIATTSIKLKMKVMKNETHETDASDKIKMQMEKMQKERERFETEKKKQNQLIEFYKEQLKKEILATEKLKLDAERKELEMKKEMEQKPKTNAVINKISKVQVKWQWNDDSSWISYDTVISKSIEQCGIGESYEYTFAGNRQTYKITKSSKDTAVQINIKTKVKRKVKRIEQTVNLNDAKLKDDVKLDKEKIAEYLRSKLECIVTWQWSDGNGEWNEYDYAVSEKIEALSVGKAHKFICDNKQTYFVTKQTKQTGLQFNVATMKQRKIRKIEQFETGHVNPTWWSIRNKTKGPGFNINYAKPYLYQLDTSTVAVAKKVKNIFNKTASRFKIIKIESLENQMLFDAFLDERKKLVKLVGKNKLNIKYLFHGTKQESVMDLIQVEGFRKEFNSISKYGKGTYFAKDASYSVNYAARKSNGVCKMFMCRVICGESTLGSSSYDLKSWPKKSNGLMYDSLVNDTKNPTIFVIHQNYRSYPMFVIYFK